jgi:hypothetical protein
MGAGLAMAPGDIAFKSNFATIDPQTGVVEKRRADRKFEHLGPQLCAALDGARARVCVVGAGPRFGVWGLSRGQGATVTFNEQQRFGEHPDLE